MNAEKKITNERVFDVKNHSVYWLGRFLQIAQTAELHSNATALALIQLQAEYEAHIDTYTRKKKTPSQEEIHNGK